ncbi:MAG: hypothetical protein ABSD71_06210 [Bacteroidales bacterium]
MKTFTKQITLIFLMLGITHLGFTQCHRWLEISSPNPTCLSLGA